MVATIINALSNHGRSGRWITPTYAEHLRKQYEDLTDSERRRVLDSSE